MSQLNDLPIYEPIGKTYAATRQPDVRIATQIRHALGDVTRVINVGAGAGSYEPTDCDVVAIDPSITMLRQRSDSACPSVVGRAESLPFSDGSFDAAMGTFTLHHWTDLATGLREVQRISSRQVFLLYEPSYASEMWIVKYFPEILELPHEKRAPSVSDLSVLLNIERVEMVPVPNDCTDGFGGAYWARPERYLETSVQAGMSMLAALQPAVRAAGTARLHDSLSSGEWDATYGHLRTTESTDLGYRLVAARS
jgi:Methyltransferase domain